MSSTEDHHWEDITPDAASWGRNSRLRVHGGWLYKTVEWDSARDQPIAVALCFVQVAKIQPQERS